AITPLLTALGIGGLAVSLALQDTLSNFFAGIYVLLDKPIRIGDTVKLESGHEGTMLAIGWRTTRLRNTSGEIIVVPNNKVVQSVLLNTSSIIGMPRQASDNSWPSMQANLEQVIGTRDVLKPGEYREVVISK